MAEQLKAEVRTHTRISGIDPGHKRLWIGEEMVSYRDLVLAWGAETVRVPVQGDASELIFPINDLEDYARFRAAAAVELVAPWRASYADPVGIQSAPPPCRPGVGKSWRALTLGPVLSRLQRVKGLQAHLSDGQVIALRTVSYPPNRFASAYRHLPPPPALVGQPGVAVDRHLRTSHAISYALGALCRSRWPQSATLAGKPTAVSYGPIAITVKPPVCHWFATTRWPRRHLTVEGQWRRYQGVVP
ncbi:hypothetical protein FQR65_LT20037 [Abscondita terminalis]|nr:hypothetical protein FQR65_LT20037 [Abscondita terminalis]